MAYIINIGYLILVFIIPFVKLILSGFKIIKGLLCQKVIEKIPFVGNVVIRAKKKNKYIIDECDIIIN